MSQNNQNSAGGGGGGFTPFAPSNYIPPTTPPVPQAPAPVAAALPFTKVNSTKDPRVLWEDGQVAVIFAGDFPANTGMGRSKTRKSLPDVLAQPIDTQLQSGVGAQSKGDLVKVFLAELLARPMGGPPQAQPQATPGRLPNSPTDFHHIPPKIAQSGSYKGMVIPDFPHVCTACGGKMYQGMVHSVHDTPDGKCPRESGTKKARK